MQSFKYIITDYYFYKLKLCSKCHSGFLFINLGFENIGLDSFFTDFGCYLVTTRVQGMYKFKIAGLRNVSKTAPYTHNGSIKTLEEVIEPYNNGTKNHPRKSLLIKKLDLTPEQKPSLIAFLNHKKDYLKHKKYENLLDSMF